MENEKAWEWLAKAIEHLEWDSEYKIKVETLKVLLCSYFGYVNDFEFCRKNHVMKPRPQPSDSEKGL